ncbi:hypothetical protein HDU76_012277, partial [Blyttiomyces sp. JEL0837]
MDPILWKFTAFRICAFFGTLLAFLHVPAFWEEVGYVVRNMSVERKRTHTTQGEAVAATASAISIIGFLVNLTYSTVIAFVIINFDTAFEVMQDGPPDNNNNTVPNDSGLVCGHKVTG